MNKFFLSITAICCTIFGAGAQNVTIPDANFKAYLVNNSAINTNSDTEIQVSEAQAFTGSIICPSLSISDLTGIEAFSALNELHCGSNSLTNLNISQNTALTILNCSYNQLTSLDLSQNSNLYYFICNSNALTNLDVSYCSALSTLECAYNDLTSLDVSTNLALTRLYCYGNTITTLYVTNNTALTKLYCGNNPLSSLNVSNNTALIELGCENTFLSGGLDVSNNTALVLFYCNNSQLSSLDVTNNTALVELGCSANQISTLDLSNNVALELIGCQGNQLTSLDLSNNTNLVNILCFNNQITSLDVSANSAIVYLQCYANQLTSLNVANGNNTGIANNNFRINDNPDLTCVEVDDAAWSTANWTAWVDVQTAFSENCAGGPCVVTIPDANFKTYLVGNTAINTNSDTEIQCSEASAFSGMIDCSNMDIEDLTGIEAFTNLTALKCQGNLLTSMDLSANTSLSLLHCYVNDLTALDLSANTALTSVDCGNNEITALDLSANTDLAYLHCGYNQITSLNLSGNTSLNTLYCQNNQLISLNIANGNNTSWGNFTALNNPDLTCIQVDDAAWSAVNWAASINGQASFSEDCENVGLEVHTDFAVMSLFPNPGRDVLTIQTDVVVTGINIHSASGAKVLESRAKDVDVSHLLPGVYFLTISTENTNYQQRFIKQ